MPNAASLTSTYRWPLIVLVALLATYGWYVFNEYSQLNDLHQRELANTGAELKRAIDIAVVTVESFDGSGPSEEGAPNPLCEFDLDQPYIEFKDCKSERVEGFRDVKVSAARDLEITAKDKAQPKSDTTYTFTVRTGDILQELPFPEAFQQLFLADRNGRVLYDDAPAKRRWLRNLRWGERGFRDTGADIGGSVHIQDLVEGIGKDTKPSWKELSALSARSTLTVGGNQYHLFVEPVTLGNGTSENLVLGGLVPVDSVRRQALAVDTYFLASLVFLLFLGLLGFPFLKLYVLDPHERFQRKDVYLLCLSTGALLALFTFAVLAVDAYVRWHDAAAKGLEDYSANLERNLLDEIDAIQTKLRDFDKKLAEHLPRDCSDWAIETDWFNKPASLTFTLPTAEKIQMEQAAWVDPTGMQVWKITTDKVSEKVSVLRRPYFRAVRDGNLYQERGKAGSFFFAPDRSITDGKFYTFVSIPSALKDGYCTSKDPAKETTNAGQPGGYAAVATVQLLTLDRVPLPDGYGFAIVNREGRVLYHNDARRSLHENLYAEISDSSKVRAMMYAGRTFEVTTSYRERPHEMHLHPLLLDRSPAAGSRTSGALVESAGLYIAVFRDVSAERASIARVFLTNMMGGPMLLLILLMGAALWGMAQLEKRSSYRAGTWLWPHASMNDFYQHMTMAMAVLLILGFAAYFFIGAWTAVAVPVLAVGWAIVQHRRHTSRVLTRQPLKHAGWHVANLTLLLICMIVVPCSIFSLVTQNAAFGSTIEAGQKWLEQQQEDVRLEFQADARALGYSQQLATDRATARRLRYGDWPGPFDIQPDDVEPQSLWVLNLVTWLHDSLPVTDDAAARQVFQGTNKTYTTPTAVSWVGGIGAGAVLLLIVLWIRWVNQNLFHSHLATIAFPTTVDFDRRWNQEALTEVKKAEQQEDQMVLLWANTEHVVNPRQRKTVHRLVREGLLTLNPDLEAGSPEFAKFLDTKANEIQGDLATWEKTGSSHSWQRVRTIFWAAMAVVALFLFATQPSLQSGLVTIATAVTGILTTLYRLYESIGSWAAKRKA